MNRIDKLVEIYNKWGHANSISPLPSADDLRFDGVNGKRKISNKQIQWLDKFIKVWNRAEDHDYRKWRGQNG